MLATINTVLIIVFCNSIPHAKIASKALLKVIEIYTVEMEISHYQKKIQ